MIRLSELTALDISSIDIARDLDVSPKLYAYSVTTGSRKDTLLLQEDTSPLEQMTRQSAVAPFWSNVLLGTSNFYPEQALGLTSFHANSEMHEVMNAVTLPTIEYKKAFLYFSQGLLANPDIKGHWIRIYCKLANGDEVTVASVVDFMNDSNIVASAPKLFESQLFNEALEIEFVDVEFLLNSSVPEIVAVKQQLFGNYRPTDYFIEYSAFTDEAIDVFVENSLQFTRLNFAVVNQQSTPVTFESSEMLAQLRLLQDGYAIWSSMTHQKYDIEQYLNTLKLPEETYKVEHALTVTAYDSGNSAIETKSYVVSDPVNKFEPIQWRPIVDVNADHFTVESTVRVENERTGLTFRKDAMLVVTSLNVHKFKPIATVELSGLTNTVVENIVVRQVQNIVPTVDTPNIVQIERKLYVQAQPLNELHLFESEQIVDLTLPIDVTSYSKLYLRIDQLTIENELQFPARFKIPPIAYASKSSKWQLLDNKQTIIATGSIKRI